MATTTKKTGTRKKAAPKKGTRKAAPKSAPKAESSWAPPRPEDKVKTAARKAAELFGMDPNQAEAKAEVLREQAKVARAKLKVEMGRLGERADELSAKFDVHVKESAKRVEQVADEVAKNLGLKPEELSKKLESGLDRWSREATKVAEEANTEIRKMYEQARSRLKDILNKKP